MKFWILCAAMLLSMGGAVTSTTAHAEIIVDQDALVGPLVPIGPRAGRYVITAGDRVPPPGSTATPIIDAVVAQSVTAGLFGTVEGFDIQGPFWNRQTFDTSLRVSLYNGDIGNGGALIGFYERPAFSFLGGSLNNTQPNYIDLSGFGLVVAPGDIYSFSLSVVEPSAAAALFIIGNVPGLDGNGAAIIEANQYAGGSAYYSNNGSPFSASPYDLGFRSYINTFGLSGVPEPSSWAMLIIGFGMIGAHMRRRTRSRATA